MNVLTVEFKYLGNETSIKVRGDSILSWALDDKLYRHLNKDALIVSRDESKRLFSLYSNKPVFGKTKKGKGNTMFYFVENK